MATAIPQCAGDIAKAQMDGSTTAGGLRVAAEGCGHALGITHHPQGSTMTHLAWKREAQQWRQQAEHWEQRHRQDTLAYAQALILLRARIRVLEDQVKALAQAPRRA